MSRVLFSLGMAAFVAFLSISPAKAGEAKAETEHKDGYGRLVLTFDDPPSLQSTISNGVLVVSFSDPVDVVLEPVAGQLPDFITAARRDPDGRAIRFALNRDVNVNTMAAGEKLFIDLMPGNWVGMPPPLPEDVVADLTRRALDAERIKKELARAQTLPPAVMKLSSGSNDDRMRLTFTFSDNVDVRFRNNERHGVLTVPGTTKFDAAMARAELPPEITDFQTDIVEGVLIVKFAVPEGKAMRGEKEGRSFVVDIAPPDRLGSAPSEEGDVPDAAEAAADVKTAETLTVEGAIETRHGDTARESRPGIVEVAPDVPRPEVREPETAEIEIETEAPVAVPVPRPVAPVPAVTEVKPTTPEPSKIAAAAKPAEPAQEKAQTQAPAHNEAQDSDVILTEAERALNNLVDAAKRNGIEVRASKDLMQVAFPFEVLPPAAAFVRGETLFVVFDNTQQADYSHLAERSGGAISEVRQISTGAGTALEIKLAEPRLASLASTGTVWVLSLGDTILAPTRPVHFEPDFGNDGRTLLKAKVEGLGTVHRVPDSEIGDQLFVVTLSAPTRGQVREREFIEFSALPTAQGLAFEPVADDFVVKVNRGEVSLTRPNGLTLSLDAEPPRFDAQLRLKPGSPFARDNWRNARIAPPEATNELARVAAAASTDERTKARVQLAGFHLANGNAAETKAVLDVAVRESPGLAENDDIKLMRGTAFVMLRRFEDAARILGTGTLSTHAEAALWRMVAEAGLGNIGLARDAFRKGEAVLDSMPPELQLTFRQTMVDIAIAAHEFAAAAVQLDAVDTLGLTEGWAKREVMRGQIAEGFDQPALALESYRRAMESDDEIAKAKARLHATNLRYQMNEIQRAEAIRDLETLTVFWRGDSTEAGALASLAGLYKAEHRWRDAFTTMRVAAEYHPRAATTAALQDEMTADFARLFIGEGDEVAPPTLESVALFYDFKELTPPGRKGDELIRKLADRLVEVDLLSQAADLLTYQVRNRLSGPAKAQVAAHAAAIELMDRKPAKALNLLHETRFAGLPSDIVRGRLILEARALSELQRPDHALEMIAAYDGDDVNRLRADILWSAHRWQSAGEALELMLGDSWSSKDDLSDEDRQDVLRSAIAYALADDMLGLDRLRAKYEPKFSGTPDAPSFDVITAAGERRGEEFRKIARSVAVSDTLKQFLEDYRRRYPQNAPPVVRMKEDGGEKTAEL